MWDGQEIALNENRDLVKEVEVEREVVRSWLIFFIEVQPVRS